MGKESVNLLRVLSVFLHDPERERFGNEIIQEAGVPAGNLYPILVGLERRGWLESEWEAIDEREAKRRKRRYYKMTPTGVIGARAELDATVRPIAERMGWAS